ncbi:MAG: hypothetical protein ABW168_06155 [Sedimenticola sp.]
MNRGNLKLLITLVLLLWVNATHSGGLDYPNRYNSMAESVIDMMDAFSSAYQKKLDQKARDRNPWSGNRYSNPVPMMPGPMGMPNRPPGYGPYPYPTQQPRAPISKLEGGWQGQEGMVLVIKRGRFRLYLNRDTFRQGELYYQGDDQLLMRDPKTGVENLLEYAESQGRLVLRGEDGQIMLFRRLRR